MIGLGSRLWGLFIIADSVKYSLGEAYSAKSGKMPTLGSQPSGLLIESSMIRRSCPEGGHFISGALPGRVLWAFNKYDCR